MESLAFRSKCAIASTLDLVGDRWTLVVVRDLALMGKRTFSEFSGSEEAIASNILSDRLERLEAWGCIARAPDPEDGRRVLYNLTNRGRELIPVLVGLAKWGNANLAHTRFDADVLAHAERAAAGGARVRESA